ncbi:glycine betaine/L-proline ABC transporter ATP-binding protein ProV [Aurantimonas sp. 22II-16-19i]|uniref:glycine betaine/L-proline ABC transporter ATP-binding protein ProV n=1 Tax=Aurantimonas sp. 22II-16-19i TaxID=1317114 RepID=UPI0009F7A9C8|nr:glycine betaine/L-proline ABC transporter ATP-binding protein ProV [Aurantimonas sp. 22II-16-19i]ORE98239.1 glycine betaine/L-proline transporter ATP-binding subunit [Aurantimonas sp. 22II-16-19i]
MSQTDALTVRNLFKVFGDRPQDAIELYRSGKDKDKIFAETGMMLGVSDASFSVREGEIFVVMGLSGSGKSTLVRMLNRLITPSAGEIVVKDADIAKMSEKELMEFRRQHVSMVFQSFALLPHLTVLQNAAFGLELSGVDVPTREKRAREALEQVGLGPYGHSYPNELSGGMQQRVGLARALANDPSLLLMDEAFSALDPLIRTEMQDELLALQAEQRRTIVFISHDLDEAMRIGDRIAIMEGGRVVQVGTPDEILNNPADDYVRSFFRGVDVTNVLSARDVAAKRQVTIFEGGDNLRGALQRIAEADRDYAYVVDSRQQFQGVVSAASLEAALREKRPSMKSAFLPDVAPLQGDAKLGEIISRVAEARCGLPVVDGDGRYLGVVSRGRLLQAMNRAESAP